MRDTTVRIAGRDYTIATLTITKNRVWRERLTAEVEPIIKAMDGLKAVELKDFDALTMLARAVKDTVIRSVDKVLDLLCEYAPEIASDRARIEAEGYDEEIFAAFGKVIAVVFPLGALVRGITAPTTTGLTVSTISKNSSEPNTAQAQMS